MRILHTIPGLNWGGMEYRVIEQVAWLNANGYEAWLATPLTGESYKRAKAAGVPLVDFDFDRPWRWSAIANLRKLLRDLKIDVADVHVTRDAKAMMACLDLVAVVRSRHITQRLKPGFMRALQWRMGSDQVVAVADCIAKAMIADGLADGRRTHVVGEWADDPFFQPIRDEVRNRIRGAWGCTQEERVIATISMLRPDKGLIVAVRAMASLLEKGLAAKLVLIGSTTDEGADYASLLREEIARQGLERHVHFPGYSDNVAESLMAVDIVVVPSIANEAQSRIVPQAFAMGKPVVATRVGGLPELVQDGVTGLLVPANDPFALAQALLRFENDPGLATACVAKAREFALGNLRFEERMRQTLSVYAKALERAGNRAYLRRKPQ